MGCCKSCCAKYEGFWNFVGCSCSDEDEGEGASGIAKERNCTDVPCLLAYFGALGMLFYIWGLAFDEGDLDRLLLANDYNGDICGKGDRKDEPLGVWVSLDHYDFKICVDECTASWDNYYLNSVKLHVADPSKAVSDLELPYPSEENRGYCVPDGASVSGYDDYSNQSRRQIEDLHESMPIIGASAGIALVMGFVFVYMMRKCLGCIVWGSVALIVCGGLVLAWFLFMSAADMKDESNKLMQQIIAGVIAFVTIVFLVIIICLRQRILIAIEVIKSAGRALADIPLLVLTPFGPQFLAVSFVLVWVIATAHMFSLADSYEKDTPQAVLDIWDDHGAYNSYGEKYPSTFTRIDYDSAVTNTFWFHFFMLLWTLQICTYWLYLVVAGAVADWYFSKRDGEEGPKVRGDGDDELSNRPILSSFVRSLKHFGTLVFASAIIATIQFIRWVLRYIERQMRGQGKIVQYCVCVLDCCLGCLESCMDCISKRALIITSITGKPLCKSFSITFTIVWANMCRVSVMILFTGIVIFCGKMCVCLSATGLSVLIMYYAYPDLSSLMLPAVVMLLLSYVIGSAFMTVFETAVDTVFLCFLLDEEWNLKKGGDVKMFADKSLHDIVGKYADMSKEVGENEMGTTKKDGGDYSAAASAPNPKEDEGVKV